MYNFKCPKCKDEMTVSQVTMKLVPGLGVVNDILCATCEVYMDHTNPMKGAPKFWQKQI